MTNAGSALIMIARWFRWVSMSVSLLKTRAHQTMRYPNVTYRLRWLLIYHWITTCISGIFS